jgi:hypothetical protein
VIRGGYLSSNLADRGDTELLTRVAADTWQSIEAMADAGTGLPADNIGAGLDPDEPEPYTSPTNIGALLWSAIAARRLGVAGRSRANEVIRSCLRGIGDLERHQPSGMFFNWYDHRTGATLTARADGSPVDPFLSSVDNAWLATGLLAVEAFADDLGIEAGRLRRGMQFGVYCDPEALRIRGGFWLQDGPGRVAADYLRSETSAEVFHTAHYYGVLNTETRMASYLGIAERQMPVEVYYASDRALPGPAWPVQTIRRVEVSQGSVGYRGMRIVPSWGGSMFEALMVPLFVPEDEWGPHSWGRNHPLYVRAQIEHGLNETGYGYWGFSPSNDPAGGYREYGVCGLSADGNGYSSDQERTRPRPDEPDPQWGDGVVTPHASFLALRYAPGPVLQNLRKMLRHFDCYGPGGFYDAVAVRSGQVSRRHLALDQGMIMAALGNHLGKDVVRQAVSGGVLRVLRPLMAAEDFAVGSARTQILVDA